MNNRDNTDTGSPRAVIGEYKYGVKGDGTTETSSDNHDYSFYTRGKNRTSDSSYNCDSDYKCYKYEYQNYREDKDNLYINGSLEAKIDVTDPKKVTLSGVLIIHPTKESNPQRKVVHITFGTANDQEDFTVDPVVLEDHVPQSGKFKIRYQNSKHD